jgi:DNA modification methylase
VIPETLAGLVVPIGSVRPYGRNPRRGDVAAIRRSLEVNGQYRPLVVNRRSGEVLAGNHTLAAAVELGWSEIAVTYVDVADAQAARIVLADNRTNDLAGYDDSELAQLLASLEQDYAGTAWGEDDVARLLIQLEASQPGADRDTEPARAPEEPVARLGDLWQLGDHRLLCGDSTDSAAVARLLDNGEPKLLATDPPYGVQLDMEWRDRAGLNPLGPAEASYMRTDGHRNTEMSGDTRADWSEAFELVPSLTVAYVWHATTGTLEVAAGLKRIGFDLAQMIVWDKELFAISRAHYHWQHEPCWYARRKGSGRFLGRRNQSTVWKVRSPKQVMGGIEAKEDHPTQKPLELYLRPGQSFYEPFCGSGTALIAGENVGRAGFAMEIDPRYVDVIVDRWQRHTGREAELLERNEEATVAAL